MHARSLFVAASCLTVVSLFVASCSPSVQPTGKASSPAAAPGATSVAKSGVPASTPSPLQPTAVAKTASTPAPLPPTAVAKIAAGEPRYGGVLTISSQEDPVNFDLHQGAQNGQAALMSAYNGLTQYDPDNPEEVIGDLAKSWDLSKDGLTLTFHLNENVMFHNGRPLTAEDARYSFERQINPPRGILAPRRSDLEAISKVEAPDKTTVRFTLKYPAGSVVPAMSTDWMAVYPKDLVEQKGHMKNDVMGTGPYKFKNYTAGISVENVRNADYFVKGRPYLDGITFYIIKDASTRLAALRTGQVKRSGLATSGLTPSDAETLKKTGSPVLVVPYNGMRFANFIINTQQQPWNDIRVRKAVHLGVDRQEAIGVLESGYGQIGSNFPGSWGIPQDELSKMPGFRQPKDADIAEAKRLLAEAGYPDGFRATMMVRAGREYENMGVFMADQLAKIGIKLDLDVKETAVRTTMLNQGTFGVHPHPSSSLAYPDPTNMTRYWTRPLGDDWGQNWQRSNDEKLWGLVDKQARAVDPAERRKMIRELDLAMIETGARPVIEWGMNLMGQSPEVKNTKPPLGWWAYWKFQNVWLAK